MGGAEDAEDADGAEDGGWLLYALGGGLGHLQRSLALARSASALGVPTSIVANTAWLDRLPADSPWIPRDCRLLRLPSKLTPSESQQRLAPLLTRPWDALVVDTFPRGLGGELAGSLQSFSGKKVWTHRDLSEPYLERFRIRERWAPLYDLIICPGDRPPLEDIGLTTAPWLIANPEELAAPATARERWGAGEDQRVIVVSAAGRGREHALFRQAAASLAASLPNDCVRLAALSDRSPHWPLLPVLTGADVLVGAGGYHTVRETQAAAVPCVGVPLPRMYDRQQRRLAEAQHCVVVDDLANLSSRELLAATQRALDLRPLSATAPRLYPGGFPNGAHAAAAAITGA